MKLAQRIELLHRSSERMMRLIARPGGDLWWNTLKKETWIHLKRSFELWWYMIRRKD